jgi:hypothetical protein
LRWQVDDEDQSTPSEYAMNASQDARRNKLQVKPLVACLMLSFAIADIACPAIAAAATLQVTNCNDAGSGSLRAALASAHDGDSVDLTALTCGTISLATGELRIDVDNLALHGPGASALTIAGRTEGHQYSVLHHTGHGTVRIEALRITDGHANFADRVTSCVSSSGTVYLNRSIVTECSTGGVAANGFSARESTISYSYAGVQTTGGSVAINSSTILFRVRCTSRRFTSHAIDRHGADQQQHDFRECCMAVLGRLQHECQLHLSTGAYQQQYLRLQ